MRRVHMVEDKGRGENKERLRRMRAHHSLPSRPHLVACAPAPCAASTTADDEQFTEEKAMLVDTLMRMPDVQIGPAGGAAAAAGGAAPGPP